MPVVLTQSICAAIGVRELVKNIITSTPYFQLTWLGPKTHHLRDQLCLYALTSMHTLFADSSRVESSGDFRSLIRELSAPFVDKAPLSELPQTDPLRLLVPALQGWGFLMAATFEPLLQDESHDSLRKARELNQHLLKLLIKVYDLAWNPDFGVECAMVFVLVCLRFRQNSMSRYRKMPVAF